MAGVTTRVRKTTIENHLRKAEDNLTRNVKMLKMLKSKGRMSYNNSGTEIKWRVKYNRNTPVEYSDADAITFDRKSRHEVASLPYGAYILGEQYTKKEKLQNSGEPAIVKEVQNILSDMESDFSDFLSYQSFQDGSGSDDALKGLLTATNFQPTSTDQYPVPLSTDTYATLRCDPGGYGGTLTTGAWPDGVYDEPYAFWTPLQLNYKNSSFAAGGSDWATNCLSVLRNGKYLSVNQRGKDGFPTVIMMTATMYEELVDALDEKERVYVSKGQGSTLSGLGHEDDVLTFDGMDCTYDVDCPTASDGEGYAFGINMKTVELCSMQGTLLAVGQDDEIIDLSKRFTVDFFGQLKFCKGGRGLIFWGPFGS